MRIVILSGGESTERDVSLASGRSVARALLERRHEVVLIDPAAAEPVLAGPLRPGDAVDAVAVGKEPPSLSDQQRLRERMHAALTGGPVLDLLRDAELVFLALHGGWGEDGHVQALLEMAGVRFTGAGSAVCAAAWHKGRAQAVLGAAGVPVVDRVLWRPGASGEAVPQDVRRLVEAGPVVAKPVADGSSVSVHRVDSLSQLDQVAAEVRAGGTELLVEPFLPGREFTVGVVGGQALPVIEIELTTPVFDYTAKYQPEAVNEVCPAQIPADFTSRLQHLAVRAHRALGFGDDTYSRADFRNDAAGTPMCLEVNALPGLTATSLLPKAAARAGWDYPELVQRIVDLAVRS
ncbi:MULTISPECIES: D-alanine--D-alanine ligase family protein [Streptomyces]|uniref:D-alanine--D-alanine ligase n=2 Tax=Streptomyces rimosus subsp. rimosus TaxID=132474 RepID=A0A8A1ULS5_STRR1|nr:MULTISPECIES: D-alanine--D-alanine ligase [Streptomyces]KOG69621.1 D-alanine--D-alanine ligase [Kitasatospora aureofaciens]MYT44993.1 D-alanine--D-alanine ligase [Streptomyces sp. SID5471]KEF08602.1 D-alanine--D-alanine ligase [Streptomyces rimosus]KEF20842.1 D-alanine--D-alanine ligase [Streptomyces rimosus]KOT43480.1 D-alanine--D-alanine ligase [Streptomyces rimosus subsp. rimosus]